MQRRFADVPGMLEALRPSYPVYCLRPARVSAAARLFLDSFPGRVLYAVKCNPHPPLLRLLHAAGIRHFDTASLPEIALTRELFPDAELYFMHPVKSRAAIATASGVYGVSHFAVDHPRELDKVLGETDADDIDIIVRLATPRAGVAYDLSRKFGARPAEAAGLLRRAAAEGCRTGLMFHVGSQCTTPRAFATALELAGEVLEGAGVAIQYLDVGGGFPAPYPGVGIPPLADYMAEIDSGLAQLRAKLRRDCVLMCEPGRALVADAFSLVVQVQLRKDLSLYINDGIYGSLSETVTGGLHLPARLLRLHGEAAGETREFTIYGPTCDSTDVLPSTFTLPADTDEGDWIEIGLMGAYSNALASHFNGFHPETFVTIDEAGPS